MGFSSRGPHNVVRFTSRSSMRFPQQISEKIPLGFPQKEREKEPF